MNAMFLDPQRPLATCVSDSCQGCPLATRVHCHFRGLDLAAFLSLFVPAFVVGGAGIVAVGAWWLVAWLAIAIGFFGVVEIRVLCSHCPHYAEPGRSLQCWANYGSPRLWRYRPGPLSTAETVVLFGGFATLFGYPLVFLAIGGSWLLLAIYLLLGGTVTLTMRRSFCSQCINLACPLNATPPEVRAAFLARNPVIATTRADRTG